MGPELMMVAIEEAAAAMKQVLAAQPSQPVPAPVPLLPLIEPARFRVVVRHGPLPKWVPRVETVTAIDADAARWDFIQRYRLAKETALSVYEVTT